MPIAERELWGIKTRVYKHCSQQDNYERGDGIYPCVLIHAATPQMVFQHEEIWNDDQSVCAVQFTYLTTGNYAFSKFFWGGESWIQSRMFYQTCFEACGNAWQKDFKNNVNNGKEPAYTVLYLYVFISFKVSIESAQRVQRISLPRNESPRLRSLRICTSI